ncbi:PQ loop repeat-domain-containing protein [Phycomyces nitens]|nr:PQ loop repeat-domain-containing protein [Phycomyces nitens]
MDLAAYSVCGYLSILCWLIVFAPQLYENYSRKSGEGLSMTFLIIWLAGDIFNLAGVIMQDLLPTMFILALWYTVADIGLVWQILHYRRAWITEHAVYEDEHQFLNSQSQANYHTQPGSSLPESTVITAKDIKTKTSNTINFIGASSIVLVSLVSCYAYWMPSLLPGNGQPSWSIVPQLMGWSSAALYVGSRIPQIVKNWRNKSTEGLSFGMFICAVLGNILFTLSIFLRSMDPHYLLINLSWIVGSCGTLVFDFTIFLQFFVYDTKAAVHTE